MTTRTRAESLMWDALLIRAHGLLSELYDDPAGVLIYWSSPVTYPDGRRPCDLLREGDFEALTKMCDRLQALVDGAFL